MLDWWIKVNDICFSPNSINKVIFFSKHEYYIDSLLASSSDDFNTIIWNVEMGTKVHKLIGHTKEVTSCSFSNNG